MAALVGQTAERIFTKLSHVVDVFPKLHGGPKNFEILHIFGPPYSHGEHVLVHRARLGRPGSRLPLRASVAGAGHIMAASHTACYSLAYFPEITPG